MRCLLTVSAVLALFCTAVTSALAQDTAPAAEPVEKTSATADATTPAQLRAQMHQTMAALIEAQSAKTPDQKQIDGLTEELQSLRQQMWAQRLPGPANRPGNWRSPGMGYGLAPGMGSGRAPGMAYGRGPAWGGGRGPGMAYGRGPAWGGGRGRGPAWGGGRGPGYGRGVGWGAGYGRGLGRQWGYADTDGDGVCDNFQTFSGQK